MSIAICGGGIAGLSTAFYLARLIPKCTIDLYEKGPRLGGWLQSVKIPCADSPTGTVLFEQGPRTLRPAGVAGLANLDLISKLGIEDKLLRISSNSPSAKNRYIYYPDRLNEIPSSILGSIKSIMQPALRPMPLAMMLEPFRKSKRDSTDESVGSFMRRRFGKNVTDRVMSAMINGIYAGDLNDLSMHSSMFGFLAKIEKKYGNITLGLIRALLAREILSPAEKALKAALLAEPKTAELSNSMKSTSMFAFKEGIETITLSIADELKKMPNVKIHLNKPAKTLVPHKTQSLVDVNGQAYEYVVFANSSRNLENLISCPKMETPTSSVYVVNVYYKDPNVLPIRGFGLLIPSCTPNNPNHVLGIVFDSEQNNPENGSKVTVMMGGSAYTKNPSLIPTNPEEAVNNALKALQHTLKISSKPTLTNATLQQNCIPQYRVGHQDNLNSLKSWIEKNMGGRILLTGSWYNGVSIGDCIMNGHSTARKLASLMNSSS
ncbi:Protoporphyrinogen oxidase [Schizosaccharomyces pombe]